MCTDTFEGGMIHICIHHVCLQYELIIVSLDYTGMKKKYCSFIMEEDFGDEYAEYKSPDYYSFEDTIKQEVGTFTGIVFKAFKVCVFSPYSKV